MNDYQAALAWIAALDARAHHVDLAMPQGGTMRWRRFGAGAPLLLIHGGHGSWLHWARNIEALARQRTVWVPDLPGFGASDPVGGAGGMDDLLSALHGTLVELIGAHTPLEVAAFSFGTVVALRLATRHPVSRLALLGAAGHGGARRPFGTMINWRECVEVEERRAALAHNLRAFMLHDPAAADGLALAVYELSCVNTRFRSKEVSLAAALPAMLHALGGIPVLGLWGGEDVTLAAPHEVARRIGAGLPNAHWHLAPHAGHWVQYEQAQAVNAALNGWFEHGNVPDRLPALVD
jgi:2-hydroxy-6-oxonona-2,4-dienedioate hydrolase